MNIFYWFIAFIIFVSGVTSISGFIIRFFVIIWRRFVRKEKKGG